MHPIINPKRHRLVLMHAIDKVLDRPQHTCQHAPRHLMIIRIPDMKHQEILRIRELPSAKKAIARRLDVRKDAVVGIIHERVEHSRRYRQCHLRRYVGLGAGHAPEEILGLRAGQDEAVGVSV